MFKARAVPDPSHPNCTRPLASRPRNVDQGAKPRDMPSIGKSWRKVFPEGIVEGDVAGPF